jgi:hypothetical protein
VDPTHVGSVSRETTAHKATTRQPNLVLEFFSKFVKLVNLCRRRAWSRLNLRCLPVRGRCSTLDMYLVVNLNCDSLVARQKIGDACMQEKILPSGFTGFGFFPNLQASMHALPCQRMPKDAKLLCSSLTGSMCAKLTPPQGPPSL